MDIEVRRLELEAVKLRRPTPMPRSSPISASPVGLTHADSAPNQTVTPLMPCLIALLTLT